MITKITKNELYENREILNQVIKKLLDDNKYFTETAEKLPLSFVNGSLDLRQLGLKCIQAASQMEAFIKKAEKAFELDENNQNGSTPNIVF